MDARPEAPISENRASMARTFTYLFGFGGLLLLLTCFLPGADDREVSGLIAVAVVAEIVTAGFIIGFDRWPLFAFKLAPALGSVLIGLLLYWGGTTATAPYAMFFFWVCLSASYFFGIRVVIANVAFACAVYALVLELRPETALPALQWVMAAGALFVAGVLMVRLRNLAEEAYERLRESEERIHLLVDNVADYAILTLDPEGCVASWNSAAEQMMGYTAKEIIGRNIAEFYPSEALEDGKPTAELELAIREGHVENEGWRVRRDGTPYWATTSITALRAPDGSLRGFSQITRDLTERWRAEHYRQAQHRATRVLAESGTIEEALPAVLQAIGESMEWPVGGAWMPEERADGTKLRNVAFWHRAGELPLEFETATLETSLARGEGLPGSVWADAKPVWIEDVTRSRNFPHADAAIASGLDSGIAIPVLGSGKVLAVIEFLGSEIRRPQKALLEMLDALSHQVGQFIERKNIEAEADRVKNEFFALVSHELRTPLTSVIGYLQLLLEDFEDELSPQRRREYLGVIDRNSRRLLRLVGDLLFVAKVEAGQVELDHSQFDLAEVARESIETFTARAETERLTLRGEIEDIGPCQGDAGRIGQAIDNLVSNSIKFTPEGGSVTLRVRRGEDGDALIEVADTGAGIPASEQRQLFDRFYRADTATTRAIEGTGLGLAIVEAIVEGHGGRVTLESAEGEGSTFRISLPMAQATGDGSGKSLSTSPADGRSASEERRSRR